MEKQKSNTLILVKYNFTELLKKLMLYCSLVFFLFKSPLMYAQTNYLGDFVPDATDSIKEINLLIWCINWGNGGGPFSTLTQTEVDSMVQGANDVFKAIPAPNLPMPGGGVAHITDTKIRLKLKAFMSVSDGLAYDNPNMAYTGIGNPNGAYMDAGSINLYICDNTGSNPQYNFATNAGPSYPGYGPRAYISLKSPNYIHIAGLGKHLAHEVGHMLGLNHARNDPGESEPHPIIAYNFACNTSTYSSTADYPHVASAGAQCLPGWSNNLMNWYDGCYEYLSPRQMAVMHYYLMTSRYEWLTAASYAKVTKANHALDYTVAAGTTTINTPRFFKGNVIVPNGSQLTIQCQVAMQNQGKIIVEEGGKLTIEGAGKVTNISGRLWEGIDVHGNPSMDQITSSWWNHGQLFINSGGTIENSINGVRNYGFDSGGNPWERGGIIRAHGAKFINNVRDVEFLSYPMNFPSVSRFDQCEFKTTARINDNNAPYVHVSLWGVKGVQFNGCTFENAAQAIYPNVGQGIHSIDAIYQVNDFLSTKSYFKGFNQAMSVGNFNSLRSVNVYDAIFDNNLKGIEFSTMESSIISGNSFNMVKQGSKGVALNECKLYSVNSNTFAGAVNANTWKAGIYAVSSGEGAHRIYRNDFKNLYLGIVPQYDNSGNNNTLDGLFMNCNTFTTTGNTYDIAMLGSSAAANLNPSVAMDQGLLTAPPDPKKLVRNQYGATCVTNGQRKWFVDLSGSKAIEHAANSDASTRPTPQPDCSSNLLNVINSGQSFNYSSHCLPSGNRPVTDPYCPCKNCCLYADISLGLSQELARTATLSSHVASLIDGGYTQQLLDEITGGGLSSGDMKVMLDGVSPYVSDTVLKVFILNPTTLVSDLITIHDQNKPFSPEIWNLVESQGYDALDMAVLEDQQDDQPISAVRTLEGELNLARADLQFIYSEKLNYFLNDTLVGAQDTVIKLLSQNLGGLPHAVPLLVDAYVNAGYYSRALTYADSLSADPKYSELMTLQAALIQLVTEDNGIYSLPDNDGLNSIISSYAADPSKAGSKRAQAIMQEVYGTEMNFVYLLPDEDGGPSSRVANQDTEAEEKSSAPGKGIEAEKTYLKLYPNPANNSFTLFYVSYEQKELHYIITDILGKQSKTGILNSNTSHEINAELFNNGIYFITLLQDNKIVEKQKLVIMK